MACTRDTEVEFPPNCFRLDGFAPGTCVAMEQAFRAGLRFLYRIGEVSIFGHHQSESFGCAHQFVHWSAHGQPKPFGQIPRSHEE